MNSGPLLDTNVPVYAYDLSEPVKQQIAFDILNRLAADSKGTLSTQVLNEFFVAVTRKIATPLSVADAYVRLSHLIATWPILETTSTIVLEAARGVRDHQMNYWDALIWATARLNQIAVILSEDFSDGTVVEGVRFVNPFRAGFNLDDWL